MRRENFLTRMVEDRVRQVAIDEAVRRVIFKMDRGSVFMVNHGAYCVPSDFIDDVRIEFRKIMENR